MTQPLRYAINVTIDGRCSHEAGLPPDSESMAFWTDELRRSDTLLYGRVTYELMEGAWRPTRDREWPDWMDDSEVAFSEVMDPMRKFVASGRLRKLTGTPSLSGGMSVEAVRRLKEEPGRGIALGGVKLPAALARGAHRRVHVRRASRDCGAGAAAP